MNVGGEEKPPIGQKKSNIAESRLKLNHRYLTQLIHAWQGLFRGQRRISVC